jgi:hypothetical protein
MKNENQRRRRHRPHMVLLLIILGVIDVASSFRTTSNHYFACSNRFAKELLKFETSSVPVSMLQSSSDPNENNRNLDDDSSSSKLPDESWIKPITEDPKRSIAFSALMATCGAALGPFLDSYHSAFGVLQYDDPIQLKLWGSQTMPALTTTWWVPELFGLAGFIIGWLYILLDSRMDNNRHLNPSVPKILVGISIFTLQYWLSGVLVQNQVDRTTILNLMSAVAAIGFLVFDGTMAGGITSAFTAIGGPLIEVALLTASIQGILPSGYHYTDSGETGFFPLWIVPVYFLGGPANGNLARGFWNLLSTRRTASESSAATNASRVCPTCNNTRQVPCPNCDGVGTYVAMGGRSITCTSCRGRGFVICRSCFGQYEGDPDPNDIDSIRDMVSRMPD